METGESRRSEAGTEQSTEDKVGCLPKSCVFSVVAAGRLYSRPEGWEYKRPND